jgi:hypothetical protein
MAAPTHAANAKKALANTEPSTHGATRKCRPTPVIAAFGSKADSGKPCAGPAKSANQPSKFPILAFDQIGKAAPFDLFSRAYVRDSNLTFVLFRHHNHAWPCRRRECNHERVSARPSFDCMDESRMASHDSGEMRLNVVIDFNEQFFLSLFAPN